MSFEATEVVIEVTTFMGMTLKNRAWATTKDGRSIELQFDQDNILLWLPRPGIETGLVMTCRTNRTGPDTHVTQKRIGAPTVVETYP